MKTPQRANAAFTLIEVLLASTLALVLMFGALYSTSESYEIAREGDRRLHTHISGRRALDRILHDLRYADEIVVTGSNAAGWNIDVDVPTDTGIDQITYYWDVAAEELRIADAVDDELLIASVTDCEVTWQEEAVGPDMKISQISIVMTLDVNAGLEAGLGDNKEFTLSLGGSTWVRKYAPDF